MKNLLRTLAFFAIAITMQPLFGCTQFAKRAVTIEYPEYSHPILEQIENVALGELPMDSTLEDIIAVLKTKELLAQKEFNKAAMTIYGLSSDAAYWIKIGTSNVSINVYVSSKRISTGGLANFNWILNYNPSGKKSEDVVEERLRISTTLSGKTLIEGGIITKVNHSILILESLVIDKDIITSVSVSGDVVVWVGNAIGEPEEPQRVLRDILGHSLLHGPFLKEFKTDLLSLAVQVRDFKQSFIRITASETDSTRETHVSLLTMGSYSEAYEDDYLNTVVNELSLNGKRIILPHHMVQLTKDLSSILEMEEAERIWGAEKAWEKLVKFENADDYAKEKTRLEALARRLTITQTS